MTRWFVVVAVLSTGCGNNGPFLDGKWEGECGTTRVTGIEDGYGIAMTIKQDDAFVLNGPVTVNPSWATEPFDGTLDGLFDGEELVEITLDMGDVAVGFLLDLNGSVDGDTMSGDCLSDLDEGAFSLTRTSKPEE